MSRKSIGLDVAYSVLLTALGVLLAGDYFRDHILEGYLEGDLRDLLGAEYDSIARAIRDGRGFSDPFRVKSGPTAWVPPALPYLLASAYWLFDDSQQMVVTVFVASQGFAVATMIFLVTRHARQLGLLRYSLFLVPVYLAANFHELFQKTHDTGLLLMLVCITWRTFPKVGPAKASAKLQVVWGVWGGICALCSPILGAVWAVLTFIRWRSAVTIAAIFSIIVVSPWTIRNKLLFDRWIPIKSNAGFELWQSQESSPFGVLNDLTLMKHPFGGRGVHRLRYVEVGEAEFIREKSKAAMASLFRNPSRFLSRCTNRLLAATVIYFPYSTSRRPLGNGWPMIFKQVVFPIPFACILIVLALRHPFTPELAAATSIWLIWLLPYVVISYYDRYAAPLIGMKLIVMLYAISALRAARSGPGKS